MKIIKFKDKKKYKYKRKVSIKNLILKISVGLHDFEKKEKQTKLIRVKTITETASRIINNEMILPKMYFSIYA